MKALTVLKGFIVSISLLIMFIGSLLCSGCYSDVLSKKQLEKVIAEHLQPGSSEQEIIAFLQSQGWKYHFNKHFNWYTAYNPKEDKVPDILGGHQIYIYVDDNKAFLSAKVEKVFNFL